MRGGLNNHFQQSGLGDRGGKYGGRCRQGKSASQVFRELIVGSAALKPLNIRFEPGDRFLKQGGFALILRWFVHYFRFCKRRQAFDG